MRIGLCCTFLDQPIKFRATTARFVSGKASSAQRHFLGELAVHNADALLAAVGWCADNGVGAFRILSHIFPLATHPSLGYALDSLPTWAEVERRLIAVRDLALERSIRLSFHPDQFVVPGSLSPQVVDSSLAELEIQAQVAELVGAEQLTLHGGGGRPDKAGALDRLARGLDKLSFRARSRLAVENDDRVFHVEDLLPLCARTGVPLVYDVHHHRCLPDALDVDEATERAASTWKGREPWVHISSPRGGWRAARPQVHADYIHPRDVPRSWLGRRMTVDVEAKAKEHAVLRLRRWIAAQEGRAAARGGVESADRGRS